MGPIRGGVRRYYDEYGWTREGGVYADAAAFEDLRPVSVGFLKQYAHGGLGGTRLPAWIYRLEERFPRLLGRWGQYPMLVLEK